MGHGEEEEEEEEGEKKRFDEGQQQSSSKEPKQNSPPGHWDEDCQWRWAEGVRPPNVPEAAALLGGEWILGKERGGRGSGRGVDS